MGATPDMFMWTLWFVFFKFLVTCIQLRHEIRNPMALPRGGALKFESEILNAELSLITDCRTRYSSGEE